MTGGINPLAAAYLRAAYLRARGASDSSVSASELIAPQPAQGGRAVTGIELIAAERERQIKEEGWTAEHDEQHEEDELAWAAVYYAMPKPLAFHCPRVGRCEIHPFAVFPQNWNSHWAKRDEKDRIRQLVVAGALIAAEIDRIQEAAP